MIINSEFPEIRSRKFAYAVMSIQSNTIKHNDLKNIRDKISITNKKISKLVKILQPTGEINKLKTKAQSYGGPD